MYLCFEIKAFIFKFETFSTFPLTLEQHTQLTMIQDVRVEHIIKT